MYEQFFNFMGLREDPFHVSPDPRFFYLTPAHETALTELLYGIETRQGFLVLTGEAGTGKTSLLNLILDWLHRRGRSSAYIFHAHLKPIGLLRFILSDFGVPCESKSKSDLVNALYTWLLQRHAAHDLPVVILDEAQALPLDTLDELRLLLNLETPGGKLLQIILSGQPELDEKLRLPALRQLRQRIMFHSRLPLLTQKETAAYISSRLAAAGCSDSSLFPDEAVEDIYASSRGIPRVVNLLCEHALISAYAEQQRVVSPEMIQRIAMDFDLLAKPLAVSDANLQPHHGRLAPFPFIEKPAPPAVAIPRFTACAWRQIEFDIFNEPPAAVDSQAQPAVREDPVPAVHSPAHPEAPKLGARPADSPTPGKSSKFVRYWRKHRPRSAVAVFARNSVASVERAWHAFTHSLACYVRSVSHSFVRDCHVFFRALTPPTPALEFSSSSHSAHQKSAMQQGVLAPIVNWLRRPISPGHISSKRSPAGFSHRK
jgi:general secretion pathway protein A